MTNPVGRPPTGAVREVRIPDPLWDAARRQAKAEKVSTAELIRRLIHNYLNHLSVEGRYPIEDPTPR